MPRKSAAAMSIVPTAPAAPPAQRPEPPGHLSLVAQDLWRKVVGSRPPEFFDPANRELLEIFCRSIAEHRRVADVLEKLDVTDKMYASLVRAADSLAKRAAQAATRLRLAKNSVSDSRAGARAVGDHRTHSERCRAAYGADDGKG